MIHIIVRSKDEGKCVMKSIDYPSHFYVGITNGCSNPCFSLTCIYYVGRSGSVVQKS